MRPLLFSILSLALLSGCGQDDDAPPAGSPAAAPTHRVTITRYYPGFPSEPVSETVDAPADQDSLVLADDYGPAWVPAWELSPEIADYGRATYWLLYRPLKDGTITLRYIHPQPELPTAVQ